MGKKGRSSRRSSGDEGYVLLALFALASVFYTKVKALDWHWRIVLGVLVASVLFLLGRALLRAVRRRNRERLLLGDVRQLSWRQFESYVQLLLRDLGWEQVKHTGGSRDGGIDLRGTYNGEQWIVQCKHRTTRNDLVEPGVVRDLLGRLGIEARHGRATRALVVTTGRFGPDSRAHERQEPVELWDGDELARRRLHADKLCAGDVHRGRWATWQWVGAFVLANAVCVLWAVASVYQVHITFR
jgi:HJR/Mrr/RecB family endonuclease